MEWGTGGGGLHPAKVIFDLRLTHRKDNHVRIISKFACAFLQADQSFLFILV